jgi:hypothetical protein
VVLKGSLREFILADIFNLIAQQKITGKLLLSTDANEGIIIFKEGIVVGAIKGEEQLLTKLFNLLVGVYRYSQEEIRGIFVSCGNNVNNLFNEIIHLNLVRKDLLESFAVSVIEDITCSFFSWTKGSYHFTSVPYVDDVAASCVSISVENIIMEAMRRVDEWHRMEKLIRDDTVFVPNERHDKEAVKSIDPFLQGKTFVYSKIDGSSTASTIIHTSCLTEYKVYEALYALLNEKRITPLSTRISQSVVAALEKKELEEKTVTPSFTTIAAIVITAAMIITTLFIGRVLLHGLLFSAIEKNTRLSILEMSFPQTLTKVAIASLQYHALYGAANPGLDQLVKVSLLLNNDIKPLIEMQTLK